ncbi:unnamed protein product [Diamesa serratosioi]
MEIPGRRESNCVKCRNHGSKIVLRGHKQYCPYQTCACEKCRFTAEQQRQMRLQNAIRRAEAQDRGPNSTSGGSGSGRRQRNSSSSAAAALQQQHQQNQQQQQQQQQLQQIVVSASSSQPESQRNGTGTPPEDKKLLFDCSSELLKKFRYPWEMMPIMYALSKYANGNIEEVVRKIEEVVSDDLSKKSKSLNNSDEYLE